MMRIALFALIASLAACSKQPPPELYSPHTFPVTVVWETQASLQQVARSYGEASKVDGFSVMTYGPNGYRCEIHIVEPTNVGNSTQYLLGHEFAHCLYGAYHK